MDRNIVYPSAIPLDTDLLSVNKNAMIGLGFLAQAVLGTSTVVDGLGVPADDAGVDERNDWPRHHHPSRPC